MLNLKYTHHSYDINKRLKRNKWTLFSIIHTKDDLKLFVDGAIYFSLDESFTDSNNTDLMPFKTIKCINIDSISQFDEKSKINQN